VRLPTRQIEAVACHSITTQFESEWHCAANAGFRISFEPLSHDPFCLRPRLQAVAGTARSFTAPCDEVRQFSVPVHASPFESSNSVYAMPSSLPHAFRFCRHVLCWPWLLARPLLACIARPRAESLQIAVRTLKHLQFQRSSPADEPLWLPCSTAAASGLPNGH